MRSLFRESLCSLDLFLWLFGLDFYLGRAKDNTWFLQVAHRFEHSQVQEIDCAYVAASLATKIIVQPVEEFLFD